MAEPNVLQRTASGPWTDLGLTLPVFVGYHLGVIFLPVRNAADVVTRELFELAHQDLLQYGLLTLAIGAAFVGTLVLLGRGHALHWNRFLMIGVEGVLYAVLMRIAGGFVVTRLALSAGGVPDAFTGLVMSLGAGFYEELAFRVGLFGVGWRVLVLMFALPAGIGRSFWLVLWAIVTSMVFSGWHHLGALGDTFDMRTFVFRTVCGILFTLIYSLRGFAPAVWTHALYDIWVLVF